MRADSQHADGLLCLLSVCWAGLLASACLQVEMFLLADGSVLLNEVAPRPHNSGHYTIEACPKSQVRIYLRLECTLV